MIDDAEEISRRHSKDSYSGHTEDPVNNRDSEDGSSAPSSGYRFIEDYNPDDYTSGSIDQQVSNLHKEKYSSSTFIADNGVYATAGASAGEEDHYHKSNTDRPASNSHTKEPKGKKPISDSVRRPSGVKRKNMDGR